jgi:hypothetical protein
LGANNLGKEMREQREESGFESRIEPTSGVG